MWNITMVVTTLQMFLRGTKGMFRRGAVKMVKNGVVWLLTMLVFAVDIVLITCSAKEMNVMLNAFSV